MRFHGLMMVRDEGDIIAENLTSLLTWVDALHIYDLGSTDNTWDIVQDFAARDPRVIPFKREPTVYADSLRSVLFEHIRRRFEAGDWIVKLDADEFHEISPPDFVRNHVAAHEGIIYLQWYFFRLTTAEVGAYEAGNPGVAEDRHRSIAERRRFYKVSNYSEPRMFRYRPTMRWPAESGWPFNAGIIARERMPIRHYPHRDPLQMERRFQLRAAIMALGGRTGDHWRLADWRQDLVDVQTGRTVAASGGRKEGLAGENGIDTGPLLFWEPGTRLPQVNLREPRLPWPKQIAQRLVYGTVLPWIDRQRPGFDPAFQPDLIPEEQNNLIGASQV